VGAGGAGQLAAEIKGVPRAVLRDQSRRRQEIVRRMEDRGESSARAAQAAALDTRRAKDYDVDRRDVAVELRTRIAAKGLGPAELAGSWTASAWSDPPTARSYACRANCWARRA
jgi:TrwC relaxase